MACWHKGYALGDVQSALSPQAYLQTLQSDGHLICLNLYLLDHSGLAMSTTPFGCPWDSGQVGYIHLPQEEYVKSKMSRKEAVKCLEAEVVIYNDYLSGQVFGFETYSEVTCSECNHVGRTDEDSCWGFYGSDHRKSGLLEQAGIKSLKEWTNVEV